MALLVISTTREGTDPPATDVVPDKNLTTLGVLGWRRFGETASGDSNYKSGGTHNGSIADIGSPAWSYYGGSNNKQAALSPYTDGTSPSSSAGTRGYRSTAVTGAGMRITIPLLGKSVKVGCLLGSYGATPRVAASLSDSSATAVTQDHAAGAATVGWWHTVIRANATSSSADLVIDVTAHSGTSLQWMGFYVDYDMGVDDYSIQPDQTFTITKPTGWNGTPTATLAGIALTLAGAGSTTRTSSVARTAFRFGASHAKTRWNVDQVLSVTDNDGTITITVQIVPPNAGAFGTKNSSAAVVDLGDWG